MLFGFYVCVQITYDTKLSYPYNSYLCFRKMLVKGGQDLLQRKCSLLHCFNHVNPLEKSGYNYVDTSNLLI